ncbi:MAG: hypothetical protein JWM80_1876 [Cyanobacteria bacterium RYN_339]|nr:hypothetical protein [Cyanobacteria bacterium RYN_339]
MPQAPDLTRTTPRSPFDELEGYAWLPRMIDKARAFYAGTHGEYSPYPCMGDKGFLGAFQLDANAIGDLIKGGADDEAIAAYVRQHAHGDKEAFRQSLRNPRSNPIIGIALFFMRRNLKKKLGATRPDVDWTKVDAIPKLLAIEEGHSLPA